MFFSGHGHAGYKIYSGQKRVQEMRSPNSQNLLLVSHRTIPTGSAVGMKGEFGPGHAKDRLDID